MKHLLKKLSFAGGGKKSKPKPKPAQLKPPVIGTIPLATSFSYIELLDLVSDGPILGLVNENGLVLSSKDMLQGVYLDDTSVAVSNDTIVQQSAILISSSITNSETLVNTLSKVFKNIQESNLVYTGGNLQQNYKPVTLANFPQRLYSSPFGSLDYLTKDTSLSLLDRVFLMNENNLFNFFGGASADRLVILRMGYFLYYKVNTDVLIKKQLESLFTIYDKISNDNNEKIYLKNIFDNNFGSGWENTARPKLITEFINSINSNLKMSYIINVDSDDSTIFIEANKSISKDKKYKFSMLDRDDDQINYGPDIKIYDLLLPRIDSNGETNGRVTGLIIVSISAIFRISGGARYSKDIVNTTFAIPRSAIDSLANVSKLSLNEIVTVINDNAAQKYNYTNILAEQRLGDEYQNPFKYFNNVLIDKDYSSPLVGPFIVNKSVQRIQEDVNMINISNSVILRGPDASGISPEEGSRDDGRRSGGNFSEWDKNINVYNENAISTTHIINNPNVTEVFITIRVDALADTLSKDIDATLTAGMNFASILNIQIETGSINQKGEESVGDKVIRRFKILALIQNPTYIDIGNPDLDNFNTGDYKFISEYNASGNNAIFKPFVLAGATDAVAKRYIKVTKLSAETNSSLLQKECALSKVTEIIPQNFSYPNSAIIATKIDSRAFGSVPTRTFDCKLKKVRVPSNYYPILSNGKDKRYYSSEEEFNEAQFFDKLIYDGDWDGEFKIDPNTDQYLLEWTDNPAWILLDLITSQRYGLGQYMDDSQIDIFDLYKIARFCDAVDDFGYFQGVPDGQGGLEPRFSCNILFAESTKVFDALNVIASLFRGIIYYNNSQINFVDDRPKDPIALFSNTNVKDGVFNYSNYRRDEQFNSIEIVYIDRFENYLTKIEYIEDEEDIRKRGVFKKTINANGVTSRAMARRLGQHLIFQTIKENQSVGFSTGLEALLCKPGDLIIVEDELKNLKSNFGKVLSTNSQYGSIRLNEKFISGEFDNKLTVYTPTGYSTNDEILNVANLQRSRLVDGGFYLNLARLSRETGVLLTGAYSFSGYVDGYAGEVEYPKQNQYAFYTGSNSRFCYYSTGFTGWVLGTGIPFSDDNKYNLVIFDSGDFQFTEINYGNYAWYDSGYTTGRRPGGTTTNDSGKETGNSSLFRDVSGSLRQTVNGLLDSDLILSSPSQITTFNISGIVQYDYGCEAFVHSSDINYSLVPFVKEGSVYRFQRKLADDQLYKVVSIKEENINEYSLVCTKFDTGKYALIENDKSIESKSNTYSYTVSNKIGDTVYQVLSAPNIQGLVTGSDISNGFYVSGGWKQVLNNQGYNVSLKNSQGVSENKVLPKDQTGAVFFVEGIGNYSFRVNAIGSVPKPENNNANFYTDSDYSTSGIFLIYEEGDLLNYDRAYLSSVTIL